MKDIYEFCSTLGGALHSSTRLLPFFIVVLILKEYTVSSI